MYSVDGKETLYLKYLDGESNLHLTNLILLQSFNCERDMQIKDCYGVAITIE